MAIQRSSSRPRLTSYLLAVLLAATAFGCGSRDEVEENNGTGDACAPGEREHPVTGECIPINTGREDMGTDPDPFGDAGGGGDMATDGGHSPMDLGPPPADMGDYCGENQDPSLRCDPMRDDDEDGLNNGCECNLLTNPCRQDTDGDGLLDNEEDANQNCRFEPSDGETNPREADTDVDGVDDRTELMAGTDPLEPDTDGDGIPDGVEQGTCLNALEKDTDGDGLPDGVEDVNGDGQLGTCASHDVSDFSYDCAQGESNPCETDTDGNGTDDSDEAQYRQCLPEDTANLPAANFVTNTDADYKLVLDAGLTTSELTGPASAEAHTFYDAAANYTGFVVSLTPPGGQTSPSALSDHVLSQAQSAFPTAIRRLSGRRTTSHDNYDATVGSIIDLPAGTALDGARDQVLANLLGVMPGDLAPATSSGLMGDGSETLFLYSVVARSASEYVVVGAFATLDDYQNDMAETGIRVDDLVGGTSLAGAADTDVAECVSYRITTKPKVDIIISIDGSGSMGEEQMALQNFAVDFTQLLDSSNLDWRAAVTLPNCNSTSGLSMEAANVLSAHCSGPNLGMSCTSNAQCVFPGTSCMDTDGDGQPDTCSSPLSGGGTGELEGGGFTDDPSTLEQRLSPGTFSMAGEAPMAAVLAASDRALPRTTNDAAKFRPDASVILIAITDEEDAWWQQGGSWGNTQNIELSATQQTELENEAAPWVDFLLRQDLGATLFGIVWPTGEKCITSQSCTDSTQCGQFGTCVDSDGDNTVDSCRTASFVGHAVSHVANETGGSVGSVCQQDISSTLAEIANAAAGIASGLRLRGTPLTPTLEVMRGNARTGMITDLPRSRADGFDYDGVVNRIVFEGPNPPQTNDQVIIPYRRWENSVFMCQSTADCPSEQKLKCVDGECR